MRRFKTPQERTFVLSSNNLTPHPQFIYDSTGKITGYRTKAGADTVFPFKNFKGVELNCAVQARFYNSGLGSKKDLFTGNVIITIDKDGNVTLPQELKLNRNGVNVPTPTAVYMSI